MTKDKALKILELAAQYCQDSHMPGHRNLRDAIAALSSPCACGGGKVLAKWVLLPHDFMESLQQIGYCVVFAARRVEEGDISARIIASDDLPADEPQTIKE